MNFLDTRLKGRSYFSDKVSLIFTFAIGVSAGFCYGSLWELWLLSFDPIYPSPYRSFVNKLVFVISAFSFVLLLIFYIALVLRSTQLTPAVRFFRFLIVIFLSFGLMLMVAPVWLLFIDLLSHVKALFT